MRFDERALGVCLTCIALVGVALFTMVNDASERRKTAHPVSFSGGPSEGAYIVPGDGACLVRVSGPGKWHFKVWREDHPEAVFEGISHEEARKP